jgi:hypothetical protein
VWRLTGVTFCDDAGKEDMEAWWESTNGGTIPTLVIPNDVDNQPRFVNLDMEFSYSNEGAQQHTINFSMIEAARGILVV